MPTPDLSNWYSKPDAAARLEISERTLDRMVAKGDGPECRERRRQGKRPEPVYNPDDVERLSAPKAHVMPAEILTSPTVPEMYKSLQTPRAPSTDALSLVLDRIAGAVEGRLASPALFMTLPEARLYSGLSLALLRRAVRDQQLPSIRDGAVKVRRADLDNFASSSTSRHTLAGSAE